MRDSKFLETLLTITGSAILLLSWGVQHFLYDRWNTNLAKLGSAEAVFHAYRAADGVHRAIKEFSPAAGEALDRQRMRSYEAGLAALRQVVDSRIYDESRRLSLETLADGLTFETMNANGKTMVELDAMQRALAQERSGLQRRKNHAELIFMLCYALGSVLLIAAAATRLRSPVIPPTESGGTQREEA